MRTRAFIEAIEELGCKARTHTYINGRKDFIVYRKDNHDTVADVCENTIYSFDTSYVDFSKMSKEKQNSLFNLLAEYASTPLEEREEEKKYYIKHKYITGGWNFLNYFEEVEAWIFTCQQDALIYQTKFTLNKLPAWVHEMLEQGHLVKEEVE